MLTFKRTNKTILKIYFKTPIESNNKSKFAINLPCVLKEIKILK